MACYNEETAQFILEPGRYYVRIGNSSRNTHIVCAIDLSKEIICSVTKNRMVPKKDLKLISNKGTSPFTYPEEDAEKNNAKFFVLECDSIETEIYSVVEEKKVEELIPKNEKFYTLDDVVNGDASIDDVVAQLTNEELGYILNGVIYEGANATANVGSMAIKVRGAAGELWSSEKYKIPVNAVADGPAGVRLAIFGTPVESDTEIAKNVVAYPSGSRNSLNQASSQLKSILKHSTQKATLRLVTLVHSTSQRLFPATQHSSLALRALFRTFL